MNDDNKASVKAGIEDGYTTPVTRNTMHEKEVLKTPKKHERILENELEESPEKNGSVKRSQKFAGSYGNINIDSFMSPQRKSKDLSFLEVSYKNL